MVVDGTFIPVLICATCLLQAGWASACIAFVIRDVDSGVQFRFQEVEQRHNSPPTIGGWCEVFVLSTLVDLESATSRN